MVHSGYRDQRTPISAFQTAALCAYSLAISWQRRAPMMTDVRAQRVSNKNVIPPRMRVSSTPRPVDSITDVSGILVYSSEPAIRPAKGRTGWRVMTDAAGKSESVPTIQDETADALWARRKRGYAHPTDSICDLGNRRSEIFFA